MSEQLLERIIEDAKKEAKAIIDKANKDASGQIAFAEEQARMDIVAATEAARKKAVRAVEIAKSAADVASRLDGLVQKTQIINQVFDEAKKELLKSDNKKLRDALAKRYSKAGDTVKQKDGGIIIENANYEIRLTVNELLATLREEIEAEVVKILFAEYGLAEKKVAAEKKSGAKKPAAATKKSVPKGKK